MIKNGALGERSICRKSQRSTAETPTRQTPTRPIPTDALAGTPPNAILFPNGCVSRPESSIPVLADRVLSDFSQTARSP